MEGATATAYVMHLDTPLGATLALVAEELSRAFGAFGSMASGHEGKAVIEEELEELWEHVKADGGDSPEAMREAIQIAAMAMRYVLDLGKPLELIRCTP